MFTPNPWEEDAYDPADPKGSAYAEHVRATSDELRIALRHQFDQEGTA